MIRSSFQINGKMFKILQITDSILNILRTAATETRGIPVLCYLETFTIFSAYKTHTVHSFTYITSVIFQPVLGEINNTLRWWRISGVVLKCRPQTPQSNAPSSWAACNAKWRRWLSGEPYSLPQRSQRHRARTTLWTYKCLKRYIHIYSIKPHLMVLDLSASLI